MNPIAKELNETLHGTIVDALLSDMGKEMFFPKGIVAQSAEASQKATRYNATVGMATQHGEAICLPSIQHEFSHLSVNDVFPYAPTAGVMDLRRVWKQEMYTKNPTMAGKETSLPVVTAGLTHGISVTADLFLSEGDTILVPDMFWGNYNLIFGVRRKAKVVSFPFFTEQGGFNLEALSRAIDKVPSAKVALILNFPNNPTGYTPTVSETQGLVDLLVQYASGSNGKEAKKLLVITDDAYFGLFFEEDTCKESVFAYLADAHENILAVKGDAATKEELVWGFRVGFLTYASKGLTATQYEALVKKTMGAVRSSVSNCSKPAQTLLLKGMTSGTYHAEKQAAFDIMITRYRKVKEVLSAYEDNTALRPLPFNSGYFMAFVCEGNAEALRLHLLDTYQIGTISIQEKYLRIAFSSVDVEDIEDLFALVYQAAGEVWK